MLAKTTAVAILSFYSSLGLAAPLATDANGLDMPTAVKERSTSEHGIDARTGFDVEKRSANPGTSDGAVDDKRATPLYWVDTLLRADEEAKKNKRDTPLYWVDTLLRADEQAKKAKRDTPLYWVDTLLRADEEAKKMKRATSERSSNPSDGLFAHDKKSDVPLYWVDTLLRADED